MGRRTKCSFLALLAAVFLFLGLSGAAAAEELDEVSEKGFFYQPPYLKQITSYLEKNKEEPEDNEDLNEVINHRVRRGETIKSIADRYRSSVETIAINNRLDSHHTIREGEVLKITRGQVVLHELSSGDTIWDISRKYGADWRKVMEVNQIENPNNLQVGTTLVIPLTDVEGRTALTALSRSPVGNYNSRFIWPVYGQISSPYGWRTGGFHYGLDIAVPTGTPVKAIAAGTVEFAGRRSGYGRVVYIEHGGGWMSVYGHASRLSVRTGDRVYQGQVICLAGETGNATGPHLHLEIRKDDDKLNPIKYLPVMTNY